MPRDLEQLLHDTAVEPSGPLDPAALVARGRRRRRNRHLLYGAGSAAAVAVLALSTATITSPTPEPPQIIDRPPSTTGSAEPSEGGSPQDLLSCEPTSLRPTYLPWSNGEEDIEDPVEVRPGTESSPNATVTWAADSDDYHGNNSDGDLNSVTVSVLHEHESAGEEFPRVEVRGHPAELVWVGDPGVGGLSLIWREDDGPCGAYSVSMLVRGSPAYIDGLPDQGALTQAEGDEGDRVMGQYREAVEREIVRIADALTESPSSSQADESQTPSEARRDGVLPAVAALSFDQRVEVPGPYGAAQSTRAETTEGVWVVSRMPRETWGPDGCGLGATSHPEAVYRRDVICTAEYGEILLLDHDETHILRAFPLPGVPPKRIAVTDDAVWCARVGDGGLPHSMLCRIDRDTHDWQVRIFPHHPSWEQLLRDGDARSGIDPATGELWLPGNWTVEDGSVRYDPRFLGGQWTFEDGDLMATGHVTGAETAQGTMRYASDTLQPVPPCPVQVITHAALIDGIVELTTTISVADGAESCGFDPTVTWELLDRNGWPVQVADEAGGEVQHVLEPGSPIELNVAFANWCGDDPEAPSTVVFHAGPFGQHTAPLDQLPDCEDPELQPTLSKPDDR